MKIFQHYFVVTSAEVLHILESIPALTSGIPFPKQTDSFSRLRIHCWLLWRNLCGSSSRDSRIRGILTLGDKSLPSFIMFEMWNTRRIVFENPRDIMRVGGGRGSFGGEGDLFIDCQIAENLQALFPHIIPPIYQHHALLPQKSGTGSSMPKNKSNGFRLHCRSPLILSFFGCDCRMAMNRRKESSGNINKKTKKKKKHGYF